MVAAISSDRRIRKHRKLRSGCANCKLRRVKCDERRPACRKCEVYRVECSYLTKYQELQPSDELVSSNVLVLQTLPCSESEMILSTINNPLSPLYSTPSTSSRLPRYGMAAGGMLQSVSAFSIPDLERLHRFHVRTMATLGATKQRHVYHAAYIKLAYSHPFLLHVILALTILHDKHLGTASSAAQRDALRHWSQAASLLNKKISDGFHPDERDALWACSALLGAVSFSDTLATTPEEAWPLNSSLDLKWLDMIEGKKAIWKVADPLRKDSVFYPYVPDFMQIPARSDLSTLPPTMLDMCGVGLIGDNPYLPCLTALADVINIECNGQNIGLFMAFFGRMTPRFKLLLGWKDPAAMVVLAYWYAKQSEFREWWVWPRARLEIQSIFAVLLDAFGPESDIVRLMEYPRRTCLDND